MEETWLEGGAVITVRIGGAERPLSEATESWVNEQMGRRRNDGVAVCVQVRIDVGTVSMILSTPACAGTGGGGRSPNDTEHRVFDLWTRMHLNEPAFASGNVVAFLKQLERML